MQPRSVNYRYPNHLLSMEGFTADHFAALYKRAERYYEANKKEDKKDAVLKGRTQINVFFENSTRTRTSFELAGKRLGMDVININISASSIGKGESLIDMAMTLSAMQPDMLVVRHPQSGAAELFTDFIDCQFINAGDGCFQHPTQALLDAFTIQKLRGKINGLRIAICGDIAHSRVARSNLTLLNILGASVCLVAPPQLMPARAETLGCDLTYHLKDGIQDADIIIVLRVQNERMENASIASIREFFHLYGLSHERLKHAKEDVLVLHPGPINRGVEIDSALADDLQRNAILDQVEAGVSVRQALLVEMLSN